MTKRRKIQDVEDYKKTEKEKPLPYRALPCVRHRHQYLIYPCQGNSESSVKFTVTVQCSHLSQENASLYVHFNH